MVKLFLGFQDQKRLSQLLYGIHAAPLSSENSADNKIELIELLHAMVTNMMSQHFIERMTRKSPGRLQIPINLGIFDAPQTVDTRARAGARARLGLG